MTRLRVAHVAASDLSHRFLLGPQLRALRDAGFDVTAISAPGPWVASLEAQGIRHLAWPNIRRALDLRADLRAAAELRRIFRRERFDVVHTHTLKASLIGRPTARACAVPCVVNTVHGLFATPTDPWAKRTAVLGLEALASRFSDCELHVSSEDLAWLKRRRAVARHKLHWIGNGVDLTMFHPDAVPAHRIHELKAELGIREGELVVGAVGRLVAKKGLREFFEVARRIRATDPGVRFLAVGAPETENVDVIAPDEMARAIDAAAGDVLFTGWREDVRDVLAVMDIWVLDSWREGLPLTAIEASAMGRAIVMADVRGCREVARHGREALLIPPRDSSALEAAVRRLLLDNAERCRLGRAARQRAEEVFDQQLVAKRVLDAYQKVLCAHGLRQSLPEAAAPTGPRRT